MLDEVTKHCFKIFRVAQFRTSNGYKISTGKSDFQSQIYCRDACVL